VGNVTEIVRDVVVFAVTAKPLGGDGFVAYKILLEGDEIKDPLVALTVMVYFVPSLNPDILYVSYAFESTDGLIVSGPIDPPL
jgi:hypothetical protein